MTCLLPAVHGPACVHVRVCVRCPTYVTAGSARGRRPSPGSDNPAGKRVAGGETYPGNTSSSVYHVNRVPNTDTHSAPVPPRVSLSTRPRLLSVSFSLARASCSGLKAVLSSLDAGVTVPVLCLLVLTTARGPSVGPQPLMICGPGDGHQAESACDADALTAGAGGVLGPTLGLRSPPPPTPLGGGAQAPSSPGHS